MESVAASHISCKVLQALPDVIMVSFEKNNKTYQGVLLDVAKR